MTDSAKTNLSATMMQAQNTAMDGHRVRVVVLQSTGEDGANCNETAKSAQQTGGTRMLRMPPMSLAISDAHGWISTTPLEHRGDTEAGQARRQTGNASAAQNRWTWNTMQQREQPPRECSHAGPTERTRATFWPAEAHVHLHAERTHPLNEATCGAAPAQSGLRGFDWKHATTPKTCLPAGKRRHKDPQFRSGMFWTGTGPKACPPAPNTENVGALAETMRAVRIGKPRQDLTGAPTTKHRPRHCTTASAPGRLRRHQRTRNQKLEQPVAREQHPHQLCIPSACQSDGGDDSAGVAGPGTSGQFSALRAFLRSSIRWGSEHGELGSSKEGSATTTTTTTTTTTLTANATNDAPSAPIVCSFGSSMLPGY